MHSNLFFEKSNVSGRKSFSLLLYQFINLKTIFNKYLLSHMCQALCYVHVKKMIIVYFFMVLAVQIRDRNEESKPIAACIVTMHVSTPAKEIGFFT